MNKRHEKRQHSCCKEEEKNISESEDEEYLEEEEEIPYFENSSESEPEIECDEWDLDSQILSITSSNLKNIKGCHLMATCQNDPNLIPKKKLKLQLTFNTKLTESSMMKILQTHFKQNLPMTNGSVTLLTNPFKVFIINNLINTETVLKELRLELYDLYFNLRNMDLYEFFQSKDLQYLKNSKHIENIYEFLRTDIMNWISDITDYKLTHMSATCSLYTNTDYLLIHDDQREDRMVAFILYLVDDFQFAKNDGGALQLFSKDEYGQPKEVVNELLPTNNRLIIFPVTYDSYHQVAEVTSLNKYRLSINGWFHTKKPPVFTTPLYVTPSEGLYSQNYLHSKAVDINLESWINDEYLDPKAIRLIQKHVEENSEISLRNFFKKESFQEVSENLQQNEIIWKKTSPINRYNYEVAGISQLPHTIERFISLFQSSQMFKLLQQYTDLELGNNKAVMKFELQRWRPGNYALLTEEYDWKIKNELDLIMYFGCKTPTDVIGARTHYVTIEDEVQNALITIEPQDNNLNIVYRDSARFTKYFSKQSKCHCFYMLICSYSE
ncbi:prolyl 3-hydroxylase OGFOD1 [Anthonomus grandis grandis]|uniref:prolyl 3-hydroxylase OGFOD1 n=1 Tax=Anthonomus grandis grandis TaxID=2921223 RepID=UPI0021662D72|nr:prolyl 3-hydroxylase OGFOD1 [Anthonomus grandis grandis]